MSLHQHTPSGTDFREMREKGRKYHLNYKKNVNLQSSLGASVTRQVITNESPVKTSLVGVSGLSVNLAVETVTSVLKVNTVTSSIFMYEFVARGDFDVL